MNGRMRWCSLVGGLLAAGIASVATTSSAAAKRVPPKPIAEYGSISVGHPGAGLLINAVPMPQDTRWVITAPSHRWGTQETIEALTHCIERIHQQFPGTPPVMLGSISARRGGKLPPHQTHRTGRDADVYFFRKPGANWAQAATREDIDLPRTWALLRCFITDTDVDHVLLDRKVQQWIKEHALKSGDPASWVKGLFSDTTAHASTAVRYAPGHVAHMHVRFVSPIARRLGVALYDRLAREGFIKASYIRVKHSVRDGETLSGIAKQYQTSLEAIQRQNRLKSARVKPGQKLSIRRPRVRDAKTPVTVPPRRLPPDSRT
jgi:murein endopeptidase